MRGCMRCTEEREGRGEEKQFVKKLKKEKQTEIVRGRNTSFGETENTARQSTHKCHSGMTHTKEKETRRSKRDAVGLPLARV